MFDCHPTTEDPKVARLDWLYLEDGRDKKDHPMHCLYTGLYIEDLRRRAAALNEEPAA